MPASSNMQTYWASGGIPAAARRASSPARSAVGAKRKSPSFPALNWVPKRCGLP
jgi:hypothetical protein